MKILTYEIELIEPLLVTSLDGDPNNVVSLDFLPGSVLRGMIIRSWLCSHKKKELDLMDEAIKRLFFSKDVRYLNGYLAKDDVRRLPAPHSWAQDKEEQRSSETPETVETVDLAVHRNPDDEKQWKKVSGFWAERKGLKSPDRQLSLHLRRNRILGRSRKGESGIYRYEALAEGQTFMANILCEKEGDAENIKQWLDKTDVSIGSSRNSGYGRVKIKNVHIKDEWREVAGEIKTEIDEADEGIWIVSLLSDMLIRNRYGQFSVDVNEIEKALSASFGVSITIDKASSFLDARLLGGFNQKWGLPLPQLQAVKMGSVIVFAVPDLDEDVIEKLEWEGIGERREDGFGRIAINWQQNEKIRLGDDKSNSPSSSPLVGDGYLLAKKMAQRMLIVKLETALIERANTLANAISKPTSSQLSRLRFVVLDALTQEPSEGRKRLQDYFKAIKSRPKIAEKFSGDRIANKPLLHWLEDSVQADQPRLTLDKPISIGNVKAELTPEQIYHYNLRLIEMVLHLATKRLQKKRNDEQ